MTDTTGQCSLLPEWVEQDGVLLAWPDAQTDWRDNLVEIETFCLELMAAITRHEDVVLLLNDKRLEPYVSNRLTEYNINLQRIRFITVPYNDTWLRDTGPLTTLCNDSLQLHDFRFNGWGSKYQSDLDNQICRQLASSRQFSTLPMLEYDFYLEGGSIDCNERGELMTTRQCLLSSTRNPLMDEADYEKLFAERFNIRQVHWINHSELIGDDTDGHIDMLARFCDANTIAYTSCEDSTDEQYESLAKMKTELSELRNTDGDAYRLVALPIPKAIYNDDGERLPASYANFLIINNAVLVPVYGDKAADETALAALASCFPGREITGIYARAVIEQSGSLHCMTMQLPKGVLQSAVT